MSDHTDDKHEFDDERKRATKDLFERDMAHDQDRKNGDEDEQLGRDYVEVSRADVAMPGQEADVAAAAEEAAESSASAAQSEDVSVTQGEAEDRRGEETGKEGFKAAAAEAEGEREEEAQGAAASGRVSREAPAEQPPEAVGAAEAAPEVAAATPVSARADASYQPEEAVLQDPSTVSLGATGQITEAGGIVTYTATVDHPPLSDLVITLSNGESITIAAGETSATLEVEVGADEDVYQDASQLSAHVTGTEGGGYSTLSIDTTPAVTQIVDTLDTTTVSLGATGHITEAGGAVTYTASVDHPPLTDLEIRLSNGETVTIEAGQTSGTVDVPVAADEDAIADATTMSAHITQAEGGGYEQLAIDANPAVTAIHDTVDTTTVSLGATGQITEAGGSVTYTASVDNAPASDLVITLSNGETITIEAGRTSGSVDLPVAADEDAIADATSLSAHITDASGGGYEQLAIDAGPAVTDIVDTVDTTSVSLGATGQLTEAGGVVTYTASVDNAPASDLVITLSNGESITIEAGQISGTVDVTVAADEDAIADASTMSAHITDTSGGGYEQLAINANPAVTEIVDTVDTTTLSLGATGQITEAGGTVTYTASVDNEPASDLEITLSNGESITIEAGKTSGTVDVPVAADEDAIADASSLSAQITGTDGGGYEQLAVNETPAVTAVVDTVDTTTVSLGATGQITEAGGTVTYTATVDNAPASDLSITLSNGEVITIAEGQTSATVDVAVAADEDAIADASTLSAHITEASGGGYEQLAVDANPAVTGIIDTVDSTTVSLGATGQITEAGGTVTYTASVDNAPASALEITLSNGETITIEAGQTSGTAEVTVAADEDATADASSMSAHITEADGGGYEQLLIDANPAVTGIIDTVDTTTVSLGATGQITEAGGSVTYTASVDNAPASDLEITLSNGESITIEAGRTSGTVDVPVAADEDAIADATTLSAHITGTDGGGYEQLAVNANAAVTSIVDTMDTTTVSLDATGEITEAGGTVIYTASVDNAPATDLEITLSNGETITIEQGQTTGTVSVDVAADEDAIADASSMSAHITDAAGGGYEQLAIDANAAVTNIVDTVETTTVSLGATGQITEAGGTVTYTASVDNAPATDMTVVLSNGESIVIEAGQVSGTVDVTVAADEDAIADAATMSAHITEASGGGFENLAVNANPVVTDIVDTVDTTTVSLGATGQITEAGGSVTYTASVDNAPASDLTITLSNGESITIEAGETSGTVDLSVAADEDAIADATSMSAHITSADGGGYEQLNVDATPATTDIIDTQDTTTVSLGATGQITEAGGSVTYTANVDNAPASDLTITLSNGESITIEAGKTSGTTDVAVDADEDAIADATTLSAHITDAEGGGYEQLSISSNPAVTSIADTVDTTTVSLGATGQITEAGGTVTYTANVDNAPATDLEVTLSNGESITIEAGETSGTLDVEVAADEDAIADASSMSAHITDTSGGGYEDLAINANPAVTDIVDTADTTTVSLGATGQITEAGGSVTYTATVDNAPASDMTIALSNGESIVIEAGQTSGTVDVTVAADEDAIADATSMSAHITDASGGGFENLAVNANAATTDIVDTTDTTTVSLGATGQITEAGGTVTYTATVDNAPASDVEITLSNGETITIEAGKSSGTVDVEVAADEDAIADATSMSAHITDASGGGYENLAVNANAATTEIVDTTDTTTVSLDATDSVSEAGGAITYTASVDNAPASDVSVTLSNGETITIKAGETSGAVDVAAGDESATLSVHISEATGGGYEQLAVNAQPAETAIEISNEPSYNEIRGTENRDTLRGTDEDDHVMGLDGNDRIYAQGGGEDLVEGDAGNDYMRVDGGDTVDGGAGYDTADYRWSETGIDDDKLSGTEKVYGSAHDDTVTGTDGADRLYGYDGDDTLSGGAGNDSIVGGKGDDTLDGGAGRDTINARGGTDQVTGGEGNDYIYADGADTVDGGAGYDTADYRQSATGIDDDKISGVEKVLGSKHDDTVTGTDGADRLYGYDGDDTLSGGAGNDSIVGGKGDDTLDGGAGRDTINARGGTDQVTGGEGNDYIYADGADTVDGGAGYDTADYRQSATGIDDDKISGVEKVLGSKHDDTVTGTDGADRLYGYDGDDTLSGGEGDDRIYGGKGDDTLDGGAGRDTIDARGGADQVAGGEGNDYIYADGADTVDGGAGYDTADYRQSATGIDDDKISGVEKVLGSKHDDTVTGTDGADQLYGYDGDDTLSGGAGNDRVVGGAGDDTLSGGAGRDTIDARGGADQVDGGEGNDYIYADGADTVDGGAGYDTADYRQSATGIDGNVTGVEKVLGSKHDDTATGTDGADRLYGYDGDDTLSGGAGADQLYGGEGDDTLAGGAGNDYIRGDGGSDTVVFSGNRADYEVTQRGSTYTVKDLRPDGDGTDRVVSVENFQFADRTLNGEEVLLPPNEAPSDITFSATDVDENAAGGTVVANLGAVDGDAGETFTYTITNDESGNFAISGNQVVVKEGADIDFESAESHQVTVQVTDSAGNSYSEEVTFAVNDLDEVASTPTLSVSLGEATESVVAGDTDYAIKLNESGNNDGLQIENGGELLAGQDELTITMNVRFDGDGLEDTTPLVSYATDDNNNEFRIELKPKGDDRFELHLDSGGDAEDTGKLDNDLLFDGEMHEISISIDANGDISYEIDGNEVATDHFERSKGHEVGDDDGVLIIGQEQDRVGSRFDDDEVFKGEIGDIKIYDTAEVTDETQPVGHWDMNQLDSETGTVADQAGNHDIKVISIDERGFSEGSEPSLVAVGETGGGESTVTYPLNIEASLGDTDGSESLAITVSGIPEDAQLSAGTDNGDGSWSLTTDQLDGLTVTVPSEGAADLDISVTATSTESEGGAQASVSQSVAPVVTVETGADNAGPTDISFSGTSVEEGAAAGTVVATLQTIDQSTGDTFSYELVRDDSGHFEIVGDQLVVKEGADIDYESDAVHQLSVKVTDSSGNTYSESINIHVDDVQEAMAATYTGGRKGDRFDGTDDDDVIDGIAGDDKLRGGEGDDVILGGGGEDKLYGDEGSDRLDGGDRSDKMYGGEGDDTLIGGEGKDKMYGDEGHDTLIGGEGNDKMYGGEGHDRFVGGEGDDKAEGGAGSDTYEADPFGGSDYFSGGEGGGWTDVIQLNADAVPDGSDPDAPWSIQVDGEQVQYDVADHALSLDPDASGVITFSDGSELTFDGVERIEW
ncbi:MAG: immunoglobulin-like domain-containing protein [Candidatus Sedimenticola sp. 20ELBAFRAG]